MVKGPRVICGPVRLNMDIHPQGPEDVLEEGIALGLYPKVGPDELS